MSEKKEVHPGYPKMLYKDVAKPIIQHKDEVGYEWQIAHSPEHHEALKKKGYKPEHPDAVKEGESSVNEKAPSVADNYEKIMMADKELELEYDDKKASKRKKLE